jgi:hypothetical protein
LLISAMSFTASWYSRRVPRSSWSGPGPVLRRSLPAGGPGDQTFAFRSRTQCEALTPTLLTLRRVFASACPTHSPRRDPGARPSLFASKTKCEALTPPVPALGWQGLWPPGLWDSLPRRSAKLSPHRPISLFNAHLTHLTLLSINLGRGTAISPPSCTGGQYETTGEVRILPCFDPGRLSRRGFSAAATL